MRGLVLVSFLGLVGCGGGAVQTMCGPTTCAGCCSASGQCVAGVLSSECGSTGGRCLDCAASSQVCSVGACITPRFDGAGGGFVSAAVLRVRVDQRLQVDPRRLVDP